jgi:fucose permease
MAQDGTATGPKELFGRLLAVAQIKMIIALALVEGAAFFNLIAFIITKSLIPPAVVGALLLVMAIHFPTKFKLALWLEDQQRLLS